MYMTFDHVREEQEKDLDYKIRGGQTSVMDFIGDANYLVDTRPCAFDRIDRLVMDELPKDTRFLEYDPDIEVEL